jgi:hypothetical protein
MLPTPQCSFGVAIVFYSPNFLKSGSCISPDDSHPYAEDGIAQNHYRLYITMVFEDDAHHSFEFYSLWR